MGTDVYEAESAGRAQTAETQVALIQRYVGRPGRLLDVGCASGLFLRCAVKAGWDVAGVELSERLCRTAKETLGSVAAIHCCALQHAPFSALSFDVITLWDVLEHVRDPVGFMKLCASLLKPNGLLFANVPNLDSIQSKILGSHWPLLLPEHLNYFSPASLRKCGQEAGLEWEARDCRSAVFSTDYIMYRLAQHHIPGSKLARHVVRRMGLDARLVSLRMGEMCGVWRRQCG
jgi:SAM-dependent methyltransferase